VDLAVDLHHSENTSTIKTASHFVWEIFSCFIIGALSLRGKILIKLILFILFHFEQTENA